MSVSAGALFFAVLSILIIPWAHKYGIVGGLVAVILATAGISLFVVWVQYLLLSYWARSFLGTWFYISDATSLKPGGHYGYATFNIRGGQIQYVVELYSLESIIRLASGDKSGGADAAGRASSDVVIFDGSGSIRALYDYTPFNDSEGGLGVLDLTALQGDAMTGTWVTARRSGIPGSGTHRWFRKEMFLRQLERSIPTEFAEAMKVIQS
jgi:hypothetical protein